MSLLSLLEEKSRIVFLQLLQLTLTLLLIISIPLIFLLYGILLFYRLLVFNVAKYFDPKLGKMVSAISSIFAAHDVYGNCYTINAALHFVGKIDTSDAVKVLTKLLETNNFPDGSPLLYPEMRQKIVQKFGYTFWKNVDNFHVEDHIRQWNTSDPDALVTLSDMHRIIEKLANTPLDSSRSPWEVLIVRNFESERNPEVKSAVICRLHHCMFDGYSILNLFSKMADNGPLVLAGNLEKAQQQLKSGFCIRMLLKPFVMLIFGSYELVGQMMRHDDNEVIRKSKREFQKNMRFHECDLFQIEDLKRIKNHFGVRMSTLNTALVVGAIKKFMERRGISPKKINMTFPLPVLNHPDKLRNYFSAGIISINLMQNDRTQLLHEVHKRLTRFRFSFAVGLPEGSMLLLRIMGSLPSIFIPTFDDMPLACTSMHSSFPGPIHFGYFNGLPVVDATVAGSIAKAYPIGSLCYSYNGVYKVGFYGDASIFPNQEDIKEIGDALCEEFMEYSRHLEDNDV